MADEKAIDDQKPLFSWKAAEFPEYQKNPLWFILVGLGGVGLAVLFIWSKSWTAAGVVIAAIFAIFSFSRVSPQKVDCKLFREGAVVGNKAYRYADLKSFWIIGGNHPSVRFARPGRFSTFIDMPLADEDPEQMRLFLSKFLPQDETKGEEITDLLARWLRF